MSKVLSALVTGGAGFIGSHLVDHLLKEGWEVTVVDNFDPYYNPELKRHNQKLHFDYPTYQFVEADLVDFASVKPALEKHIDIIVHLAAKAGVRPSLKAPLEYQKVNVEATQHLLEFAQERAIKQFVFASSSSVYGINPNVPWKESDHVLLPISPYASSKVSCELVGHVYSHLYDIRFIGLRFFTVYGPRQRPDLAIHKFVDRIISGEPITMYGDGTSRRDYTYVSDIVSGIRAAMDYDDSLYEIINIGNNRTVALKEMIQTIEEVLERKAVIEKLPPMPGDVPITYADISKAQKLLDYYPQTTFREGIKKFYSWIQTQQQVINL